MLLEKLVDYQIWADEPYIEAISGLTDEDFTRDLGAPLGIIRDRCKHVIGALLLCFRVLKVDVSPADFKALNSYSREELVSKWKELDGILAATVREGIEGNVTIQWRITGNEPVELNREEFIYQYISHTTYHRGQLKLALKVIGKEIKDTDYLLFLLGK